MSYADKIFEGEADVYRKVCDNPRITIAKLKSLFPNADIMGMVKKWENEQWVSFSCMGDNPGLMAADRASDVLKELSTTTEAKDKEVKMIDKNNNECKIKYGFFSFRGNASRSEWWRAYILTYILPLVLTYHWGATSVDSFGHYQGSWVDDVIMAILLLVWLLRPIYLLPLCVRRSHDQNHSGGVAIAVVVVQVCLWAVACILSFGYCFRWAPSIIEIVYFGCMPSRVKNTN